MSAFRLRAAALKSAERAKRFVKSVETKSCGLRRLAWYTVCHQETRVETLLLVSSLTTEVLLGCRAQFSQRLISQVRKPGKSPVRGLAASQKAQAPPSTTLQLALLRLSENAKPHPEIAPAHRKKAGDDQSR